MHPAPSLGEVKLAGLRVLVVEDSFLVAASLKRILQELGCSVVGPAPTVREASRLIDNNACDAAILDINLGKETAEPVAEMLQDRHVPFIFVTGYTSPKQIQGFNDRTRLMKPIDRNLLEAAMLREFKK
jgi:two-component SAPR family response regulator